MKMRKIITLALPIAALSLTSCGNNSKNVTYDAMRRFATEHYDQNALDAIPAIYRANFNKFQAGIDVSYATPDGGNESFNINFAFNGIHLEVKDRYAVCLSSTLVDMIEQYYSNFLGLAVSLKEEPPIQMLYQLFGDNHAKVKLGASEKLVSSFVIELVKFINSAFSALSDFVGYVPLDGSIQDKKIAMIFQYLQIGLSKIPFIGQYMFTPLVAMMDYTAISLLDTSKAHGETFDSYLSTDSYGFLNEFSFLFKSEFDINGLMSIKHYASDVPAEKEHPDSKSLPYKFNIKGSIDFDFDVTSEFVR